MTPEEKLQIEERIVELLKTVYDPEIPVDRLTTWDSSMRIELNDDYSLDIDMTLTDPQLSRRRLYRRRRAPQAREHRGYRRGAR